MLRLPQEGGEGNSDLQSVFTVYVLITMGRILMTLALSFFDPKHSNVTYVSKCLLPKWNAPVCFQMGGQSRHQLSIFPKEQSKVLTIKYITNMLIEWHRNVPTVWLTCFHTFIDLVTRHDKGQEIQVEIWESRKSKIVNNLCLVSNAVGGCLLCYVTLGPNSGVSQTKRFLIGYR